MCRVSKPHALSNENKLVVSQSDALEKKRLLTQTLQKGEGNCKRFAFSRRCYDRCELTEMNENLGLQSKSEMSPYLLHMQLKSRSDQIRSLAKGEVCIGHTQGIFMCTNQPIFPKVSSVGKRYPKVSGKCKIL